MSDAGTAPTQLFRGTIVLDGQTIRLLSRRIPIEYLSGYPAQGISSYLDLLNYLKEHGYRLRISEAVTARVGGILADGRDFNSYFPARDASRSIATPFLTQIAQNCDSEDDSLIVPNTGPQEADDYCDQLHRALDTAQVITGHGTFINHQRTTKNDVSVRSEHLTRKTLMNIQDHTLPGLATSSVRSLIKTLAQDEANLPIFALSDISLNMGNQPYHDVPVRAFFHSLGDANLLEAMGFRPGISAETLFRDVAEIAIKTGALDVGHRSKLTDDGRVQFLRKYRQQNEFADSLRALKADIDAAPKPNGTDQSTVGDGVDDSTPPAAATKGADRFKGKFGAYANLSSRTPTPPTRGA